MSGAEPASQPEGPPRRVVHQPRQNLLPGAPTFQHYIDAADKTSRALLNGQVLPLQFLRDEYISSWGDN